MGGAQGEHLNGFLLERFSILWFHLIVGTVSLRYCCFGLIFDSECLHATFDLAFVHRVCFLLLCAVTLLSPFVFPNLLQPTQTMSLKNSQLPNFDVKADRKNYFLETLYFTSPMLPCFPFHIAQMFPSVTARLLRPLHQCDHVRLLSLCSTLSIGIHLRVQISPDRKWDCSSKSEPQSSALIQTALNKYHAPPLMKLPICWAVHTRLSARGKCQKNRS